MASGGIAKIRRWMRAGDLRTDRGFGPGPWLTIRSGVESLEDVEAVSHTKKGETKPPRAQVPHGQDQDRSQYRHDTFNAGGSIGLRNRVTQPLTGVR